MYFAAPACGWELETAAALTSLPALAAENAWTCLCAWHQMVSETPRGY